MDIKAVDNVAADNKITTPKNENKSGVLLNTNYWLEGLDYKDKNAKESEDIYDDEKFTQRWHQTRWKSACRRTL